MPLGARGGNGKNCEGFWVVSSFSKHRKLGWLLLSFVVGVACWWTLSVVLREPSDRIEFGGAQIEREIDSNIPQPKLSPSDVVTLQVNSLRDGVVDVNKLKVCYSLASPENRRSTGPFSRFVELVMTPPYDRLANCEDWQVGGTFIDKNLAAVLVSAISKEGDVSAFRFVLQRQDSPRPECWLTEGVQFLEEDPVGWRPYTEKELDRKVE